MAAIAGVEDEIKPTAKAAPSCAEKALPTTRPAADRRLPV